MKVILIRKEGSILGIFVNFFCLVGYVKIVFVGLSVIILIINGKLNFGIW